MAAGHVTFRQVGAANGYIKVDQGSGLGVVTDVTTLAIQSGDRVFTPFRKEDQTKIAAATNASPVAGHLSTTNTWGTEGRTFTYVPNIQTAQDPLTVRAIQSLATAHSLSWLTRTATGAETSYTHNWASGSGGREGLGYFVALGLAGASDVELIGTAVSGSASANATAPTMTTIWENEMILVAFSKGLNTEDWTTAPSGWTLLGPDTTDENMVVYYREYPTVGTVTGTVVAGTNASSNWTTSAIRLKPADVAASGPPRRSRMRLGVGIGL